MTQQSVYGVEAFEWPTFGWQFVFSHYHETYGTAVAVYIERTRDQRWLFPPEAIHRDIASGIFLLIGEARR